MVWSSIYWHHPLSVYPHPQGKWNIPTPRYIYAYEGHVELNPVLWLVESPSAEGKIFRLDLVHCKAECLTKRGYAFFEIIKQLCGKSTSHSVPVYGKDGNNLKTER